MSSPVARHVMSPLLPLMALLAVLGSSPALSASAADAADSMEAGDAVSTESAQPSTSEVLTLEEKPRWEFGVGGGYVDGFDYPASGNANRTGIALPYFIYRSAVVRLGGGGLQAIAIENPRIKLDLSIGGSLRASSAGNALREGMPDLDFLVELGPQLTVLLSSRQFDGMGRTQASWNTKLRAVVSTDLRSLDSQGLVFETGVRLTQRAVFNRPVDVLAAVNLTATTEALQDYFYEVDAEFVTPERPAFDAQAGYLGAEAFLGLVYRPVPDFRLFAGVIAGRYNGAANQDSPLFETTATTTTAVGFVWTLKTSRETVPVLVTE